MAQTTDAMTFRDAQIDISTNGSSWTDVSGFENELTLSGGDRQIAELFTGDADVPVVEGDKRASLRVTIKSVYTEGASDPQEVARAAYENNTPLYVRWSPKGADTGEFLYTTAAGVVVTPPYPQGRYGSGEVLTFDCTIAVPSITKSVVA